MPWRLGATGHGTISSIEGGDCYVSVSVYYTNQLKFVTFNVSGLKSKAMECKCARVFGVVGVCACVCV